MARSVPALALICFGAATLATGSKLLYYLKPSSAIVAAVMGLSLVVLGVVALKRRTVLPRVACLLFVPALVMGIFAPSPLGVSVGGQFSGRPKMVGLTPLPKTGTYNLDLQQLYFRWLAGPADEVDGLSVRTIGFVSNSAGNLTINRHVIYCCAADAQTVTAKIITDETFPDDEWVQVTGSLIGIGEQPIIRAEKIQKIEPPLNPYLLP